MNCSHKSRVTGFQCTNVATINDRCPLHSANYVDQGTFRKYALSVYNKGILDYSGIKFINVNFIDNVFGKHGNIIFTGCTFKDCLFNQVELVNPDFSQSKLFETEFHNLTISGSKATFLAAKFQNQNNNPFRAVTFKNLDKLDFSLVEWESSWVPLSSCFIISNEINFTGLVSSAKEIGLSIINDPKGMITYARDAFVAFNAGNICLDSISHRGKLLIRQAIYDYSRFQLDLQNVDFDGMISARLVNVGLSQCSLARSNIEKLDFINANWPVSDGRKIIYDQLNTSNAYASRRELNRLYIQLKKNYEDKRDYDSASDWHFREMETRHKYLKEEKKELFTRAALCIYKLASSYGENFVRPLGYLFLVWILFSILFLYTGFHPGGADNISNISYNLSIDGFIPSGDIAEALIYSISNIFFINSDAFASSSIWTKGFSILQKILMVLFSSLFFLALRRRFKR